MSLVQSVRQLLPPMLFDALKRVAGRSARYRGGYSSWGEAATAASGYDSEVVLQRVLAATRKVLNAEAAFERDSVLFEKMEHPFHLLAPLLRTAIETHGRLSVLDYGGSLGNTYRVCKSFLDPIDLRWNVIEQPSFVAAGRAEFATESLRFYETPEQIPQATDVHVALFSSSLQYLQDPRASLIAATRNATRCLIIDRTPFAEATADHICVQQVPRHIYPCSYPMWIFGYRHFLEMLAHDWSLAAEFSCPEGHQRTSDGLSFEFRGLILRRRHIV